jgi:hypothetical protein
MARANSTPSTPQPLRALTMFDHVPAGCMLHMVPDDDSAPHLRAGEFAVIDTGDTDPQHGEIYLVRWSTDRPSIQQVIAKRHRFEDTTFIGFWTRCLNFEPYSSDMQNTVCISHRSTMDGPREADVIKKALVGRVVGFYAAPLN